MPPQCGAGDTCDAIACKECHMLASLKVSFKSILAQLSKSLVYTNPPDLLMMYKEYTSDMFSTGNREI